MGHSPGSTSQAALTAAGEGRCPYCGRYGKAVLLDLNR